MKRLAATAALLAVLSACTEGASDEAHAAEPDERGCIEVSRDMLAYLAERLRPDSDLQLLRGFAVELPTEVRAHGLRYAIAVELDQGDYITADFATAGISDEGPVIALDEYTQHHFTWGPQTDGDSALDEWIEDVEVTRSRLLADQCIRLN